MTLADDEEPEDLDEESAPAPAREEPVVPDEPVREPVKEEVVEEKKAPEPVKKEPVPPPKEEKAKEVPPTPKPDTKKAPAKKENSGESLVEKIVSKSKNAVDRVKNMSKKDAKTVAAYAIGIWGVTAGVGWLAAQNNGGK